MNLIPSNSSWSHEVSIFRSGENVQCHGTIISSYLILTLASCIYGNDEHKLTIKTKGINGQNSNSKLEEQQIRSIDQIIFHPGFKNSNSKNDLAILVLDQDLDINLNSTAQILPILNTSVSNGSLDENPSKSMNFSGFLCGQDSELSSLEISQPQKCPYSSYKSDKLCLLPIDSDSKSDSSSNDTNPIGATSNCSALLPGSSLICSDEERESFLCGIFALSLQFMGESPNIYTNVTHHLKWIESASAKANESRRPVLYEDPSAHGVGETVVNGVAVNRSDPIPYQLSIQYQHKPPSGRRQHFCGAVILDETTAISAAHCFDININVSQLVVVAGAHRLNATYDGEQIRGIKKIILHPKYKGVFRGNDIAVLHIGRLQFNNHTRGIQLSPFSAAQLSNMTAEISGWGQVSTKAVVSNSLQKGNVTILPPAVCQDFVQNKWKAPITGGLLCVTNPATQACRGDSGGPLVIKNFTMGNFVGNFFVGISSFAPIVCGSSDLPSGFTETRYFYKWIQENRETRPCGENRLPCLTGGCYHEDWECDKERDCRDGTDEMDCSHKEIPANQTEPAEQDSSINFFVTLNLPYSVIKYETFDLQVIVHNYLDRDVNVQVNLFNRQKSFSFFNSQDKQNGNATRYIKVQKNQVAVAHFVITPVVIGDIPIHVSAVTEDGTAGDSMIRPLKVKPEGVKKTRSQLLVLRKTKVFDANLTRNASFDVKFPVKAARGVTSLQLTAIGDPMGTMVANSGHLLKLSTFNGDSSMVRFVANIFTLQYLSAISSKSKDILQRTKKDLQKGYYDQLQFKKQDGSFAVWADLDGTAWLTSYVLRWLVVAQQWITVDSNVIKGATEFLQSKQQSDGSFVETGPFYHPEMRGRSGANGVALTAYITLALIKANETSNSDLNLKVAILNGLNFLSRDSVYQLDDNYITNLVTATLVAGNHPDHIRFFEKMEKGANTTTTKEGTKLKYWDMKNSNEQTTAPLAIEMTSYALLAHLWRRDKTDSSVFNIHRCLLFQRNPQGGFISTQDTTMGLTALTEFALKTVGSIRNEDKLQLNIRASSAAKTTKLSVSVARSNRMVLQEFTLPISTKVVNVSARGSGPALIQLTESWYAPVKRAPRSPQDQFNVTASMTIPDANEPTATQLNFCVNSFTADEVKDSIASIDLPSGYVFESEDFEEGSDFMAGRPKNVQRFELKEVNTKLEVYFNSVPQDPPVCISPPVTLVHKVANVKSPPILVYEYLNPDNAVTIIYSPPKNHGISTCQLCKSTSGCKNEEC